MLQRTPLTLKWLQTNFLKFDVQNSLLKPSFCKISSLLPGSAQVEKLNFSEPGSLSYEINKNQKQNFPAIPFLVTDVGDCLCW